MCGIVGQFNFYNNPVDYEIIKQMTDIISHRGPDDSGIWINKKRNVGLGHRRLSIIDLSDNGHQPMCNEDETIWLVYNGEIYNFHEIRSELVKKGHIFRSETDSEIVIHSYEEWGYECVHKFNGMFAFAIRDEKKQILWLVRDRIGIKPLFYYHHNDTLLFASEIKSIISSSISREIDNEALSYYLSLNYTPAPHTLFKNIRQVMPGSYLIIDEKGNLKEKEYWDLEFNENYNMKDSDYIDEFQFLLTNSVRKRMISDVPLGIFLSGGLDSSSIAQVMSSISNHKINSFSIGFKEQSYNELDYADMVSGLFNTNHRKKIIIPDLVDIISKLVWHSEEPTADSSMIGVYYLSQMASRHVKVVHSGDGGDEILAGYETYQAYYLHKLYSLIPGFFKSNIISPMIQRIPASEKKMSLEYKLKRFVNAGEYTSEEAHGLWRIIFNKNLKSELLLPLDKSHPAVKSDVLNIYRSYFDKANGKKALNRLLYVDTRLYLPNDMLVKVDRMTMAYGLEARVPFLDHRLVEFLATVPPKLKLKYMIKKKYMLKKIMKSKLPDEILYRKKAGFNFPISQWIKGDLKSFTIDLLSAENVKDTGIFNYNCIQSMLTSHFNDKKDYSHHIWSLIIFMTWWKKFIKN